MNEELEAMLVEKGISPTAMRILVLEYLLKQTTTTSLQDLERDFSYSDRTTLYRTLKTFEEKGLVHEIKDGTETTKYALCAAACKAGSHYDLHLHFYCYSCKQTFCLPKHKVPDVLLPEAFILKELNLIAKGICNTCSENNAIQLHEELK
ncbi:Fur family transcriptional regulator [Paracnuella aquatica]|uniref:Fur family transcriptional regulator n=1 Tax=Paracnuella aquatica TaxID=2268757 RepID=UPI000DEF78ED|nr:transcriptional repressor [Paracnuella aquatica]RPD44033.1 transcriptional repressor [Paracnuella aquatica]